MKLKIITHIVYNEVNDCEFFVAFNKFSTINEWYWIIRFSSYQDRTVVSCGDNVFELIHLTPLLSPKEINDISTIYDSDYDLGRTILKTKLNLDMDGLHSPRVQNLPKDFFKLELR